MSQESSSQKIQDPLSDVEDKPVGERFHEFYSDYASKFKGKWMATGRLRFVALFFMLVVGPMAILAPSILEFLPGKTFLDIAIDQMVRFAGIGIIALVLVVHVVHILSQKISDVPALEEGKESEILEQSPENFDHTTFGDRVSQAMRKWQQPENRNSEPKQVSQEQQQEQEQVTDQPSCR